MGTFVTASPHVPLPANKTDANPPSGLSYEIDAADLNNPQNAINDVFAHVDAWVNAKSYGAAGDWNVVRGTGRDDGAVFTQAAAAAAARRSPYSTLLLLPPGIFRIATTFSVAATRGITIRGAGKGATILYWDGAAGQDVLNINSSQHVTLEGFSIYGVNNNAKRPGCGIKFDYSSVVYAATALTLRDIQLDGDDATACFDYGIRFSAAYGNNSEVGYWGVSISKYKEAGVSLEGSQQKAHHFYGCNLNGLWDGVAEGVNGGKYGIDMTQGAGGQGGQFQWHGGNCTSHSEADFRLGPPNDPVVIEGCQSEGSYRFIDGGSATGAGYRALRVKGNRIDSAGALHAADFIRLSGVGPFDISENDVFAGTAPVPYIKLYCGQPEMHGEVARNSFRTASSRGTLAVQYDTSSWVTGGVVVRENLYVDGSVVAAAQLEYLNSNNETPFVFPAGVTLERSDYPGRSGKPMLAVDYTTFTAAATSQVVKVLDLPRGVKVKGVYLYQYNQFAAPGLAAAVARVGSSSGGNEWLLDQSILATQTLYGHDTSHLGANFTGTKNAQGGVLLDFANTTSVYVKVTATGANVNTFTQGYFFLILDLELVQRFVFAA